MTIYVMLMSYTEQGIRMIKDSPKRVDKARDLAESEGGKIRELYLTMGGYDLVAVSEFPDDATAARFALALGSFGNVRTTTLKAFPEAAFREIINSLP